VVGTSTVITFSGIEIGLRLFYPKYQYAAESEHRHDNQRIWSRNPNSKYTRIHPDTAKRHLVYHNNLALRQNRDFSDGDLASATNIGFFGDSYTENLRLPAPYSFHEPLDFLLNQGDREFNVLNFGIDGYGTDQSFLYYRQFRRKEDLDFVYYVFSANDLRNIHENNLFYLDDNQLLVRRPALRPSLLTRVISRFHLTYLIIEAIDNAVFKARDRNKRIDLGYSLEHAQNYHSPEADRIEEDFVNNRESAQLNESILLLIEILKEWEQEVNRHGARFSIVLLPREIENRAEDLFRKNGFRTVNLFTFFNREIADYNYGDWCFKKDPHWNEAANYVAVKGLFADLSRQVPVGLMPSAEMDRMLFNYYSAFDYGWMPREGRAEESLSSEKLNAIRWKYSFVEASR
jgi:hypothetical protein